MTQIVFGFSVIAIGVAVVVFIIYLKNNRPDKPVQTVPRPADRSLDWREAENDLVKRWEVACRAIIGNVAAVDRLIVGKRNQKPFAPERKVIQMVLIDWYKDQNRDDRNLTGLKERVRRWDLNFDSDLVP